MLEICLDACLTIFCDEDVQDSSDGRGFATEIAERIEQSGERGDEIRKLRYLIPREQGILWPGGGVQVVSSKGEVSAKDTHR